MCVCFIFLYPNLQADEEEKEFLKKKIQTAIAAQNDPESPMST